VFRRAGVRRLEQNGAQAQHRPEAVDHSWRSAVERPSLGDNPAKLFDGRCPVLHGCPLAQTVRRN